MFDLLKQAEAEIHHLMTLDGWSSMLVTYEQPVVEIPLPRPRPRTVERPSEDEPRRGVIILEL